MVAAAHVEPHAASARPLSAAEEVPPELRRPDLLLEVWCDGGRWAVGAGVLLRSQPRVAYRLASSWLRTSGGELRRVRLQRLIAALTKADVGCRVAWRARRVRGAVSRWARDHREAIWRRETRPAGPRPVGWWERLQRVRRLQAAALARVCEAAVRVWEEAGLGRRADGAIAEGRRDAQIRAASRASWEQLEVLLRCGTPRQRDWALGVWRRVGAWPVEHEDWLVARTMKMLEEVSELRGGLASALNGRRAGRVALLGWLAGADVARQRLALMWIHVGRVKGAELEEAGVWVELLRMHAGGKRFESGAARVLWETWRRGRWLPVW